MIILNNKYVLHIPTFKHINIDDKNIISPDYINILKDELSKNEYSSMYVTKAQGHYKKRTFDEILITIYAPEKTSTPQPDDIFKKWFKEYNHLFKQESFAYELNDKLYIEKL